MNKQQIIEKYTRSQGSWGITKDFIIIDDIPKMLEELDRLEQQPISEERIKALWKKWNVFDEDIRIGLMTEGSFKAALTELGLNKN